MTSEEELKVIRRAYARQITAAVNVADDRIENAFAEIRREDFLEAGPWPILRRWGDYAASPSADPVYLYVDEVVGILPERRLNNGQPSLHAYLLSRAGLREGEHVVHVGAGAGYYSAIMGHLVGQSGRVTAIEFEPELAARARNNLRACPHVSTVEGNGAAVPFEPADVIYVNAGATRPADAWLNGLKEGGRLVLPLTTKMGGPISGWSNMHRRGAVFLITRAGHDFHARWISPVAIYPCEGMRDEASERALASALEGEGLRQVTRLHRTDDLAQERCWLRAPGWCLAYE